MTGLSASRAFCFLLLGTGAHASSNVIDGASTKPTNLRRILSDSLSLTSLSANPEFEACSAEEECAGCLEIDPSTQCAKRDVSVVESGTCDDVRDVICCVFENNAGCMTNYRFRAAIASLEDICTMELPCLGGQTFEDDFENLAPSEEDETEEVATGPGATGTETIKTEASGGETTGAETPDVETPDNEIALSVTSGATPSFGFSFPAGLKVVTALSLLMLSTGRGA